MSIPSSPAFREDLDSSFGDYNAGDIDPEYECDAPQFADLLKPSTMASPFTSDGWFGISAAHLSQLIVDKQNETPYSERAYDMEPLYDPLLEGNEKTPVASSEPRYLDENTPTPRPKKTLSFDSTQQENSAEEEILADLTGKFSNLRTKPFTPVKPSKLFQSTTWADVCDTPEDEVKKHESKQHQVVGNTAGVKAKPFVPTRSTKPLTVPVGFNFSQRKPLSKVNNDAKKADLEKNAKKPANSGVTIPKPFRFHSNTTAKATEKTTTTHSPYVSLAEKVKAFDKTPNRFKPLPRSASAPVLPKAAPRKITRPITPKFQANNRLRKPSVLPTEESEVLSLKTQQPFKARPVDLRILHSHGDFGVPRIKKAPTTVPHSPNISKPKQKSTNAEQPPSGPIVKSHPYVPPKPFQPKIEHREIKPLDFKLPGDEISEKKKHEFLEKLKKEEESKKTEFKAQPINMNPKPLFKSVQQLLATDPQSPALLTKLRGKQYAETWREKLRGEEMEAKQMAEFKAQPVPDLDDVFIPKPSDKRPTEVEPIVLNTEIRAEERHVFDLQLQEQEEMMEAMKAEHQRELDRQEREEVRKLRKLGEFKAQPMKKVVAFEPKKSDKPLTEPMSPYIGEKRRLFKPNY